MSTYAQKLAQSGVSKSALATLSGVSLSAVSNYFARRYRQCGRENRKAIELTLVFLGIKAARDPKASVRRKMRAFHLAGGGLRKEANPFGLGHIPDEEIDEMIFGTIK